jgi:hypothetical protein
VSYATVEELAGALGIRVTPENTGALQACLDAARVEIDHFVDAEGYTAVSASWLFDAAGTAADPGAGELRRDKSNPPAVAFLYVSATDADGATHGAGELQQDDRLRMHDPASAWDDYVMTGPAVDNTSWLSLPVDYLGSSDAVPSFTAGVRVLLTAARPTPLITRKLALANRVNLVRGVEWWKSNDAAFGVIGFDQVGSLQAPRDSFMRHQKELIPLKARFGVA